MKYGAAISTPGRWNCKGGHCRRSFGFYGRLSGAFCVGTVGLLDADKRASRATRAFQPPAPCGRFGNRLPFLPHTVEKSAFAGMPSTETCMTCHSQVWKDAPVLEPVRASFQSGVPLRWTQVYYVPDYVYFNHSIHVNKGVGCVSCHGRIDQMPITFQPRPLYMRWCLDCHRNPEKQLRPTNEVFNLVYRPPHNQTDLGKSLALQHHLQKDGLTDCYTCHR